VVRHQGVGQKRDIEYFKRLSQLLQKYLPVDFTPKNRLPVIAPARYMIISETFEKRPLTSFRRVTPMKIGAESITA